MEPGGSFQKSKSSCQRAPCQISNYWEMFQEALKPEYPKTGELESELTNPTRNLIITQGDQRDKQTQKHHRAGSCISEKNPLSETEMGSENILLASIKYDGGKHTPYANHKVSWKPYANQQCTILQKTFLSSQY